MPWCFAVAEQRAEDVGTAAAQKWPKKKRHKEMTAGISRRFGMICFGAQQLLDCYRRIVIPSGASEASPFLTPIGSTAPP
jgi:hypothetical protein